MSVTSAATLRQIAEESGSDPRGAVLRAVGDISGLEPAPRHLLVVGYIRPEKTRGGIIRIDKSLAEDRFQGKVGLVLKLGPLCFQDDRVNLFDGFKAEVGDWVLYNPSDGFENFHVADNGRDGCPVRWLVDTSVFAKVRDPARIY